MFTTVGYIKFDHLSQIVFTTVGYIKFDHLSQIVFTTVGYIKFDNLSQIVFTTVGYIKLDHLSRKMCHTNCVIKYIKFLKRYICVHCFTNSTVSVWLFLELWDAIYLLVTSEYVFLLLLRRSGRVIILSRRMKLFCGIVDSLVW